MVAQVQEPKDLQVKDIMYAHDLRFLPGPKMLNSPKSWPSTIVGLSCIMSLMWPRSHLVPDKPPESMDAQAPVYRARRSKATEERSIQAALGMGQAPYRWERYRDR